MVINYDRRPDASIDQKLQSLIESISLALNEKANANEVAEIKKKIKELENA